MKIYKGDRATGKTTYLVNLLRSAPGDLLVVHSEQEADRLREQYQDVADRIYSVYYVYGGRLRGKQFKRIHVDNLDLMLPYLLGGSIGAVTTTDG